MRRALTACLVLVLATPPAIALGEDPAAGTLLEGDRVRLEAPSMGPTRVVGQVLAAREDGLRLTLADGREVQVSPVDIRQLEVARGLRSRTVEGAAIGALAGATVLLGALIADRGVCDEDLGGCEAYGTFAVIGAASGTLLGALIGSQVKTDRWERIPQPQRAMLRIGPTPGKGVAVSLSIAF